MESYLVTIFVFAFNTTVAVIILPMFVTRLIEFQEMVVVLRIELHCDACCEEMKRRILNIKGIIGVC